jgi:hypothetical protein
MPEHRRTRLTQSCLPKQPRPERSPPRRRHRYRSQIPAAPGAPARPKSSPGHPPAPAQPRPRPPSALPPGLPPLPRRLKSRRHPNRQLGRPPLSNRRLQSSRPDPRLMRPPRRPRPLQLPRPPPNPPPQDRRFLSLQRLSLQRLNSLPLHNPSSSNQGFPHVHLRGRRLQSRLSTSSRPPGPPLPSAPPRSLPRNPNTSSPPPRRELPRPLCHPLDSPSVRQM